jgi:hypothetical protein
VAQDLPQRGRSQCRNRFQYIYSLFKRNPLKSLDNITYGTVKAAHRKQRRTFAGLDETFRRWTAEQGQAAASAGGPNRLLPGVDPEGQTVLPSGVTVGNRDLCRFVRYLQGLLPAPVPQPLEPLPPPRLRAVASTEDELPVRPLNKPRYGTGLTLPFLFAMLNPGFMMNGTRYGFRFISASSTC